MPMERKSKATIHWLRLKMSGWQIFAIQAWIKSIKMKTETGIALNFRDHLFFGGTEAESDVHEFV